MTPATPARRKTTWTFSLVSAGLAFLLWSAWALWVNRSGDSGASPAWMSGMTQGACSFVITLCMVRMVTWFFTHLPAATSPFLPALLTVLVTGTCLVTAHTIAGTPRVVGTVAPALVVAFLFNVFTCHKLATQRSEFPRS